MERIEYDLLLHWFVGLGVDDPVWDHSTFPKNRGRLLEGDIAAKFLSAGLCMTKVRGLARVDLAFTFAAVTYNLVWLPKLLAGAAP